ncbi:helix-turn-helix transcriptional regulator [Spiractinospora alimapuensis]|uniref:helix-turn-helix domain-containing protein n=1 Tax=Spiractinospora alimapuensis TaxID=2820884 RepID=UPI001F1FEE80|nr:AraC family transcriptional regulator [Spiractinospora alimapuensis]QVQ50591.1 helix-turn-helix transcriptional regulator [Spiractinospora alimapuensis]
MDPSRDRLRQLLDAVLAEPHDDLTSMAAGANFSPFHFSRMLRRGSGESPVAMRRRVVLERAAWQLRHGDTVTDVALTAGYESIDGFTRAFHRAYGRLPSTPPPPNSSVWLPAPNGIHYHPQMSLWVDARERSMNPVAQQLLLQEIDDIALLLDVSKNLSEEELFLVRAPDHVILPWDGEENHLAAVLDNLVWAHETWLASLEGHDTPTRGTVSVSNLASRHADVAPRWLTFWREIERRGAWDDTLIDALCDPPESFQMASVLAHVITFSAHRRQIARTWLRQCGLDPGTGDPILWQRDQKDHT